MRKVKIVSFLFVLTLILIAGVMGANQVNAVVCPAGYVCTPTSQTTVVCPAGYICEPVKSTPTVITGLTYKKEDGSELKWCYSLTKNLGELDGAPGYESTGADVVALQSQLIGLGYDIPSVSSGGSARGQFDEDTKKAVMKYQASKGIPSTGYVGPLTRASLNGLCNSSVTSGQSGPIGNFVKAYYNKNPGKIDVSWIKYADNFDYYQIVVGNSILNREIQLGTNIAKSHTSYSAGVPMEFASFVRSNEKGQDAFYVKVNAIKSDAVGGSSFNIGRSELFTISPSTSPSPTPSTGATSIKVLSPNGGESYVAGSSYNIKWYDDEDAGNKDIYLISSSGQITTLVKKVFVRSSGIDGTYSYLWKVTDQIGTDQYRIKICKSDTNICDISDNLFQISVCPAGYKCNFSVTSPTPTPSPTQTPAQPSISFTYPRYSETWYLGETKNVSWTYNNFGSSMSGEKYVELQLIPQDGRAPVVLGTYTAPYGYQPLTIYTKTSTGRDAWLPGEYKLRLVCRATNIDGFRNCRTDVPGYITVKAPMPTPTSTPVSVNPNNDLNAAIWSAVEEYNRGR